MFAHALFVLVTMTSTISPADDRGRIVKAPSTPNLQYMKTN